MIQPLELLCAALEFGALSCVASPVDASLQLSSAREDIAPDSLPRSPASTLKAAYAPSTHLVDINGVRSSSQSKTLASLNESVAKVMTGVSTLSQTPTSTEVSFTSEFPIAMNGIVAESSIVLSRPPWTPDTTTLPSAYPQSTIPLALPIVTAVLLGIILLILLTFSILLCQRIRSTDHDLEGGIRVTVGQNKLQHIRLPAMPMSPILKDF